MHRLSSLRLKLFAGLGITVVLITASVFALTPQLRGIFFKQTPAPAPIAVATPPATQSTTTPTPSPTPTTSESTADYPLQPGYSWYEDAYVKFQYPTGAKVTVDDGRYVNTSNEEDKVRDIPPDSDFSGVQGLTIDSVDGKVGMGLYIGMRPPTSDGAFVYSKEEPLQITEYPHGDYDHPTITKLFYAPFLGDINQGVMLLVPKDSVKTYVLCCAKSDGQGPLEGDYDSMIFLGHIHNHVPITISGKYWGIDTTGMDPNFNTQFQREVFYYLSLELKNKDSAEKLREMGSVFMKTLQSKL